MTPQEYPAEIIKGKIVVKPIVEKKGKNIKIKVPNLSTIAKQSKKLKENGKRNIQ